MKRLTPLISLLALIVLASSFAFAGEPKSPDSLKFELEKFQPSKAEKAVLSNGMTVFFAEDHELPLVRLFVSVKGGGLYDPADKVGLASLAMSTMDTGGSKKFSPDKLVDELDFRAASLYFYSGKEFLSGGLSSLVKEFDWTLAAFADVLRYPRFDEDKMNVERDSSKESIRKKWDTPGSIAYRLYSKLIYGEDSPWARRATLKSMDNLSRKDLKAFHKKYFAPGNIMIGVYGDFDSKAMLEKLEKTFGSWKDRPVEFPEIAAVEDHIEKTKIYHVQKDLDQTTFRIGHLGVRRHNPDEFKIQMMNYIFGAGGFNSRLFYQIRTVKGLAYSVWGRLGSGLDRGTFMCGGETKAESTVETLETIIEEMKKMRTTLPTEEELRIGKHSEINSFVFQFENAGDLVWDSLDNLRKGYAEDYWDSYLDKLRAVSAEDVKAMSAKYFHPDRLVILVVGDESKFDKPLSTLGEVEVITLESETENESGEK